MNAKHVIVAQASSLHPMSRLEACTTSRRAGRGFTLLELMVAISILTVVLLSIGQVLTISQAAIQEAALQAELEAHATLIMDRIANDVKESGISVMQLFPTSGTPKTLIQYQPCTGYVGAAPTYGPVVTFAQGLINGKYIVARNESGYWMFLSELGVPNGLTFNLTGSALDISLTLSRNVVLAGTGTNVTYTAARTTRVKIRNP